MNRLADYFVIVGVSDITGLCKFIEEEPTKQLESESESGSLHLPKID